MRIAHPNPLHLFSKPNEYVIDSHVDRSVKREDRMPCVMNDSTVLLRQRGKIVFVATRFKTAVWYACYDTIDSLTGLAILPCLLFEGILRFSPVC